MTRIRYRAIADDLRARLSSGEFPVGSALPGYPALQQHYEVPSLGTVRQAVHLLEDEGLVRSEHGRGTFVVALPHVDADRSALEEIAEELRSLLEDGAKTLARLDRWLERTRS